MMRLLYSPTSPYARKVRAVILEKGLGDQVRLEPANPLGEAAALQALNPLGKIPTLVLDDGRVVFDSPVICAFLDGLGEGRPLIAADPAGRLDALTREALADGIMDAAFSLVMELRRPEAERSGEWMTRWREAIRRAAAALQPRAGQPDLGDIAVAAALGYLDFRLPDLGWRDAAGPETAAWAETLLARPSLMETAPPA